MPETITLHALDLSGETTLKLFLRKDDGTLLNTGGDDLTEIGSSGVFQATLGESRTGLGDLSYRVCDGTETADNLLIDGFLPETETTIGASGTVALDSAIQTQVNNIENAAGYLLALQAGAISNPQTATETYSITAFGSTFTVALAGLTSTGTRAAPTLTKT